MLENSHIVQFSDYYAVNPDEKYVTVSCFIFHNLVSKNVAFNHPFGIALLAIRVIFVIGVPSSVHDTMRDRKKHEIVLW